MQERVGQCEVCGREVFCLNGFLDGVAENGRLHCFDCADREAPDGPRPQVDEDSKSE